MIMEKLYHRRVLMLQVLVLAALNSSYVISWMITCDPLCSRSAGYL